MNAEEFCDKLEGYYDSWKQASADPARYAHVKIRWTRLGPKQLESKQWYHYLGEEKPYRSVGIKFIPKVTTSVLRTGE